MISNADKFVLDLLEYKPYKSLKDIPLEDKQSLAGLVMQQKDSAFTQGIQLSGETLDALANYLVKRSTDDMTELLAQVIKDFLYYAPLNKAMHQVFDDMKAYRESLSLIDESLPQQGVQS